MPREALGDLTESQVLDETREAPHPPGHGLEHGQRDGRMAPAEVEHGFARNEDEPRRFDGDGRGDIALAVEERRLAQRRARALRVEHLLAAAGGDLAHLHAALGDDQQAAARVARLERVLPSLERAQARVKADSGTAVEKTRYVELRGNVQVLYTNGTEIESDSLKWDQANDRVATEGYVKITKKDGSILTGRGLETDPRFTSCRLKNPAGAVSVPKEETR